MNTLQKEILQAIADNSATYPDPEAVKAAAEVCLRWIQKALNDASMSNFLLCKTFGKAKEQWLKNNGLTE